MSTNDGSESVDQFLARIASLSEKKDSGDAERSRKMEEDMMQARRERQARRAERARSISPVKTGPAATLPSSRPTPPTQSIEPPVSLTPRSQPQTPTKANATPTRLPPEEVIARPLPRPPPEETEPLSHQTSNATSLSRSGTLSWQQRPLSRGSGSVRSRPLSAARSPVRTPAESPKAIPATSEPPELSRQDIAASLLSKDPSWFRQTQDRGAGSAAFRKTQEEEANHDMYASSGRRLPGMPSQPTHEDGSRPRSRGGETTSALSLRRGQEEPVHEHNAGSMPAPQSTLIPHQKPPELAPSISDEVALGRSASILTGRSPSPTKGLGGFVESAMMKRSDSVNKRWSVRATPGLKRGDSVAGNRPAFNTATATVQPLGHARTLSRDPRPVRDGTSSPLSGSRPSSRHNEDSGSLPKPTEDNKAAAEHTESSRDEQVETEPQDALLSRSPSKTLDPRRWSPTKASWLESALSKPDSPRTTFSKPEQPSWKVGLERSKSQKEMNDGREQSTSTFAPIKTTGFLRSTLAGADTKSPPLEVARSPPRSPVKHTHAPTNANDQTSRELEQEETALLPSEVASESTVSPPTSKAELGIDSKKSGSGTRTLGKPTEPEPETDVSLTQQTSETVPEKHPPALKPKPQPSPKPDLRANLKPRITGPATTTNDEPEFKSVFGKLKPAQTQNYKAPDLLKDNITRGKAGLNITGGPQKTKRVDDFKESILQKKEAMRAGGGSIHNKTETASQARGGPNKTTPEIPEALARRNTLHKTKLAADGEKETPASDWRDHARKPEVKPKPDMDPALKTTKSPPPSKPLLDDTSEVRVAKPLNSNASSPSKSRGLYTNPTAGTITPETDRGATHGKASVVSAALPAQPSAKDEEVSSVISESQKTFPPSSNNTRPETIRSPSPGKHNLAARLNPALAGLIARTNSPKPLGDSSADPTPPLSRIMSPTSPEESHGGDPGVLTHATKARARGPKRRAPKMEASKDAGKTPRGRSEGLQPSKASHIPSTTTSDFRSSPLLSQSEQAGAQNDAKTPFIDNASSLRSKPKPISEPLPTNSPHKSNSNSPTKTKARPPIASKSPELRKVSDSPSLGLNADRTTSRSLNDKSFKIATDDVPSETTGDSKDSLENVRALSTTNTPSKPLTPSKTRLNTPKPAKQAELRQNRSFAKLGASPATLDAKMPAVVSSSTMVTKASSQTKSDHTTRSNVEPEEANSARSAIQTLYGAIPRVGERSEFDTEAFLKSQNEALERVKTISNQIWEVTGDGKKSTLPPQQEHILYEDSMYLAVHTFEADNGNKGTEAYLWYGDGVGEAMVEDAQLFCRKVARENSAKLEVVKQGKEHNRFFSALGGIVITRRNKTSALYMLCGRRHLGHVAFDEVELSPSQLCSGFPFLISAKFGKLYLWKGQGSGADEIGAARLIGMDLGLTGEMEEVEEGREPTAFWESFPSTSGKKDFTPSEVWSMRSAEQHKGFPCRLYRVENERPKSSGGLGGLWGLRAASPPKTSNKAELQEISPYSQKDLDSSNIHLLDAYSTVYVLPGASSSSKVVEFVTSLHIAQELAVLSPSVQDRALLPSCEVVFGEPPADFRSAFRKWVPGLNVDSNVNSSCFEVADVLRNLG